MTGPDTNTAGVTTLCKVVDYAPHSTEPGVLLLYRCYQLPGAGKVGEMLHKIRGLRITGGVAASVFILSAFYLFVSNAGLGSLISVKAAVFFALGTFVAAVIIGISADLLQRSVSRMLWQSITNPISPKSVGRINAIGAVAVVVWQVFVTFLFTKLAYEWFTIYFAV